MKNDSMSVTEVIVIDTAASDNIIAMRSGTGSFGEARLQAANITNVSSIPIPVDDKVFQAQIFIYFRVERLEYILSKIKEALLLFENFKGTHFDVHLCKYTFKLFDPVGFEPAASCKPGKTLCQLS